MTDTTTRAGRGDRVAGHRQTVPRSRGQRRRQRDGSRRDDPRHHRRERRRQVDVDEDALRRPPARRGDGHRQRRRATLPLASRRDRGRDRDGVPALPAGRQLHGLGEHRARRRAGHAVEPPSRDRDPPVARPRQAIWPRGRPERARQRPRRRPEAARRDPQGPVPRRPDHHPRRTDGGPCPPRGRRAVRLDARAHRGRVDGDLHLPQARRGAAVRRRDHGHQGRQDRR